VCVFGEGFKYFLHLLSFVFLFFSILRFGSGEGDFLDLLDRLLVLCLFCSEFGGNRSS
jgi:hypothetical protein